MTREDAIVILKDIQDNLEETRFLKRCAIDMAIEALQENESLAKSVNEASELLRKKRPHGEWREVDIKPLPYGGYTCNYKCNKCNYFTKEYHLNFCPNCGAKMKSGVERIKVGNEIYTQDPDKQGWTGKERR